ncbi:MAG: NAD(P)-dependent oxidoreductase [Rhizobiaceae bacterium]|nr:NAD(P)-dependent oxidoreductase [Rhizobiaceae bacterium]
MRILITGAAGKVGSNLTSALLADPSHRHSVLRALCHNRRLPERDRLEVVTGNIADRASVERAMAGVTHVVHLATCKDTPDDVMDVTVKGLFWLLESFRTSPTARQFILLGGDAAVGHFFYEHDGPLTEATPHMAYPGCYALSKVLEEVMVQQFVIQYGIDACCLRAPWIMEKDDFRYSLSFGDDVFGGPDWKTLVPADVARSCRETGTVPLLLDTHGRPLKRNFVHVDDLVAAILAALGNPRTKGRLYNIAMDEPVDYGALAAYLAESRGLPSIEIASDYRSNWLDNTRARFELGWRPRYDLAALVDAAWDYRRADEDPRKIWYPG